MLNARLVDMVAIEWNVGLFSICYMKGCNVCKLHGGILFRFIWYLVLLQFPQLKYTMFVWVRIEYNVLPIICICLLCRPISVN